MSKTLNTTDPKRSDYGGPCPRCSLPVPNALQPGGYTGALSRYDNETYVCSSCGSNEALMAGHLIPLDLNLYSDEATAIRTTAAEASK